MKIKIIGAGSIGNHLSHAARRLGWDVVLCDVDPAALERTRTEIYPSRYGAFDAAINLCLVKDAPRGGFDLICVGTPPDSHVNLAFDAVAEAPRAMLIEKPVCRPDLDRADALFHAARETGITAFVGYDHVVGTAARAAAQVLTDGAIGSLVTLDVEFREHWGGIFAAHPWLDGPHDSYLGYWRRGGGASGEHSHAINLWQHFAHVAGAGRVISVAATLDYVRDGTVDYDRLCLLNLTTEGGLAGRVVQDVVTRPPRKWARLQGDAGFIEWHCGYAPGQDAVIQTAEGEPRTSVFDKTRPDDFIAELRYVADHLTAPGDGGDLALARGLDTMLVVAAAHRAAELGRTVQIDYTAGWTADALQPV